MPQLTDRLDAVIHSAGYGESNGLYYDSMESGGLCYTFLLIIAGASMRKRRVPHFFNERKLLVP